QKVLVVSLLVLLGVLAGTASAETYTWVDGKGTIHFTEDISQVPKKYLKKVRVRGDMGPSVADTMESGEEAPAAAATATPASTEAKAPEKSVAKKEVLYGGRAGKSWKADFDTIRAEMGASDDQVSELSSRLGDTGSMSRIEYLSIQNTIKNLTVRRAELEKKFNALNDAASRAGVPGEFR
ncbi:MAG: DUF4124 domain-containing protein, partial [Geobacteraceae bacterium]|nr:DUF4124 domain-containing protein [Geobacteraceae bacterium]